MKDKITLAQEIQALAEKPASVESGDHAAAQSALARMGYDLAKLVLSETG